MDAGPLLDAAFVRELEVLRRRLVVRAPTGASGDHASRRRGGSAEFREHRPYAPGDDLRRIDWAAYARTGEPILKTFRAEEDTVVRLLVDASASLGFGTPSKLDVARRFAAAVGYMALAGSERAQLFVGRQGLDRQFGAARGRGALAGLLRALEGLAPDGATDLARTVETIVARCPRPGLLVAVSDFLDGGPVLDALGRARATGHDVALVHVVAPEEAAPDLEGDFELVDAETGAVVEATIDASAVEAYLARFAGLCAELGTFARRHRASYVRVRTDEPLDGPVRRFVQRSVD